MDHIYGYKRADGSYGIRNHVAILSLVDSVNPVARHASSLVRGTIPLCCGFGRGEIGKDREVQVNTRIGLANNPNVYGVVIVSLESDSTDVLDSTAEIVGGAVSRSGKPVEIISVQKIGGTIKATEKAVKAAGQMVADSGKLRREVMPWSGIVMGVECGGSDGSSGIVSNPVAGLVADEVVDRGGTVIMSETVEVIGGENILAGRAESPEVRDALLELINSTNRILRMLNINLYNLTPDNISGGLSTAEEKSLGAIKKGGSRNLCEVIGYGEKPSKKGLIFMDGLPPGVENMTGLASGGANVIIFSTGKGNTIGNPVSPTIKVSGNPETVKLLADNIDVDLSEVLSSSLSLTDACSILKQELIDVCNGKLTRAEILNQVEIAISRNPFSFL